MANMLPQEPLTTQPVRWSPAHRAHSVSFTSPL